MLCPSLVYREKVSQIATLSESLRLPTVTVWPSFYFLAFILQNSSRRSLPGEEPAWPMLDDRPLPRDLEFAIQNESPDALFARLWGYWPKPDFECLYYKLIGRLFQDMVLRIVLRILYYLPFRGTFPSLSYFS